VDSVEAGLVEGVEGFLRESLPLVAVSCVRDDVAFGQSANRGAQFLVFVGEAEQVERWVNRCSHWISFSCASADRAALAPHMP
jgi:hypothetical protein